MNHTAACYKGVRPSQVGSLADAASPTAVSHSAPAVVPRLAAAGVAPSRVPVGPSLPGTAVEPGKPRARPPQIPAAIVGNDGGDGLRYTSPVLAVVGKGGGQPLDPTARADMEARLGSDFSDVRIHTSDTAAGSAAAISAKAYTVGNNVVFGQGSFDPASHQGRHRLAHELVHVQQQREGPVSGTDGGGGVKISDPADSFEQEAEATAARVVTSAQLAGGRGLRGGHQGRPSTRWTATQPTAVQRQTAPPSVSPMPQDAPLSSGPQILLLGSTPGGFDPTRGDPVPGYERPRKVYTDTDREAMIKEVNKRQQENNENVMDFASEFSGSIITLWSTHLTDQMSRAAAAKAVVNWRNLTEMILEEALITALGMGLGGIGGLTAELFFEDHIRRLLTEKVVEVFGEVALKTAVESAKGKVEQDEIEKTRNELDEKTPKIAKSVEQLLKGLVGALNIPWADYGAWLAKAGPDQLATFRLPKIFAHVDNDKISTAAAGAIVTALHESHTNDEPPSRIGDDPTESDETSYFDDFQIISHLQIDELGALSEESTEVYVRNSSPLLIQLKGKPIGLMGQVPLFVAITVRDAEINDLAAAQRIMRGVSEEVLRRYGISIYQNWEWDNQSFVQLYPPRERELRITRSPKSVKEGSEELSGHVAVRGGGLGEHYWLLHWAPGGLDWQNRIIGQITDGLGDVVKSRAGRMGILDLFPFRETAALAQQILEFWREAGAEALISKYVAHLKPDVPEDRWGKDYFDKGTRRQILKR